MPAREPLDVQVVREWREDGGNYQLPLYTVGTFKGAKSRVAAYYGFPVGKKKLPAILHLHGGGQRAFIDYVKYWVGLGYAAMSINWGGNVLEEPETPNTVWGKVDAAHHGPRGRFKPDLRPDARTGHNVLHPDGWAAHTSPASSLMCPPRSDENQLRGELQPSHLPRAALGDLQERLLVVLAHPLVAAAEGGDGVGDDEVTGRERGEETAGTARLLTVEAGEGLEEEGDVGRLGGGVAEDVAADGSGIHGEEGETAVEEGHGATVDVEGGVAGVGRQAHPGQGEGVEAAGEVEDGARRARDGEEVGVEAVEERQALAGGGVAGQCGAAGIADRRLGAAGACGLEVGKEAVVVGGLAECAEDLVEAAPGGLDGGFQPTSLRQLALADPPHRVGADRGVLARAEHGRDQFVELVHWISHRGTEGTEKSGARGSMGNPP